MKKIVLGLFIVGIFSFSLTTGVSTNRTVLMAYNRPWEDPDPLPAVNIRNLGTDSLIDTVLVGANVEIIVQATGSPSAVYYSINGGSNVLMNQWGTSDRYYATWTPTSADSYSITAIAGTESHTVLVQAVNSYVAHLYFEIDYMIGHEPSQIVLDYWSAYWNSRAIELVYKLDDAIPYSEKVSDVYSYEAQYNDWEFQAYGTQDDRCFGVYADSVFLSQEKWILWASFAENSNVGGATYVELDGTDNIGGNYILICDEMIENFESTYGIPNHGAEVCVATHEAGHAIGILIANARGRSITEVYDAADYYNIMSSMHLENCGFDSHWYYAANYWNTRNIEFYA